jgi:hypothetical protein
MKGWNHMFYAVGLLVNRSSLTASSSNFGTVAKFLLCAWWKHTCQFSFLGSSPAFHLHEYKHWARLFPVCRINQQNCNWNSNPSEAPVSESDPVPVLSMKSNGSGEILRPPLRLQKHKEMSAAAIQDAKLRT